jgi:tRNA 5-methylaminomethyl-2-thiouridine biosynthesis bifunctional protein
MVTRGKQKILVIGAGLAGAACARALARAGLGVELLEANPAAAQGASGNPLAILHPLFSRDHNLASRWVEQGMGRTQQWVKALGVASDQCGVLQLMDHEESQLSLSQLRLDQLRLAQLQYWPKEKVNEFLNQHGCLADKPSGPQSSMQSAAKAAPQYMGGLWAPTGAWVSPVDFVDRCLRDATTHGAVIRYSCRVQEINHAAGWVLTDQHEKIYFDQIVVCAAQSMDQLIPQAMLSLNAIRGVVSVYQVPQKYSLPAVVCAQGYATPAIDGRMVVGASYERITNQESFIDESLINGQLVSLPNNSLNHSLNSLNHSPNDRDQSNLDRLAAISPMLAEYCQQQAPVDRSSIRSATLDRMPLVGRVLDWQVPLRSSVSQIHHMPRLDHVYVLGGLGSRGLSSAALGAELITEMIIEKIPETITGQVLNQHAGQGLNPESRQPIAAELLRAVDPVRFALRKHQRQHQRQNMGMAAQAQQ